MWNRGEKVYHISKDKRYIESSEMICGAFENLIGKIPYAQINISNLCKEAKVGRVTFYRHFDSLDDILRKKCDDKFILLLNYLKEYQEYKKPTDNFLTPFLRFWYINTATLKLIFNAEKEFIIAESIERILIPKEQQILVLKPLFKTDYYTAIRSAVFIAVLKQWLKNNLTPSPDDLANLVLEQFNLLINS